MQLWIYTSNLNNRKSYILDFIFNFILGVNFKIIGDETDFINHQGPKISYSNTPLSSEIHFAESAFINQIKIEKFNVAFADWEGLKIPFAVENSVFSFDVFAASFYFLSRYEEYVTKERDNHVRFSAKSAMAYKNGFLQQPIIDVWAYQILDQIKKCFPNFKAKQRSFRLQPTLDIDRPYYYLTDSFFKQKIKKIKHQLKNDPFDIYEQVSQWDQAFCHQTIYFFLVGNSHENDPAPALNHPLFKDIIYQVAENHPVGIHPSYHAHLNVSEIKKERNSLIKLSNKKITISRQHFLLMSLPNTYRDLIAAGIKEDFTMAYADGIGFRASTCTPFFWYDLEKEQITDLLVHPTAVMDQTLRKYLGLSPSDAKKSIKKLMENVKKVNGTFISLWHNESINDFGIWKDWKSVYIEMLERGSINNESRKLF